MRTGGRAKVKAAIFVGSGEAAIGESVYSEA
jgi:hypothetical protein